VQLTNCIRAAAQDTQHGWNYQLQGIHCIVYTFPRACAV